MADRGSQERARYLGWVKNSRVTHVAPSQLSAWVATGKPPAPQDQRTPRVLAADRTEGPDLASPQPHAGLVGRGACGCCLPHRRHLTPRSSSPGATGHTSHPATTRGLILHTAAGALRGYDAINESAKCCSPRRQTMSMPPRWRSTAGGTGLGRRLPHLECGRPMVGRHGDDPLETFPSGLALLGALLRLAGPRVRDIGAFEHTPDIAADLPQLTPIIWQQWGARRPHRHSRHCPARRRHRPGIRNLTAAPPGQTMSSLMQTCWWIC